MERINKLCWLGLVLACVAPAMAVSFYEIPASGGYGTDAFTAYNYNPTPDEFAVIDWENAYTAPYASFMHTPYYENAGTGPVTIDDPTAQIRHNMITNPMRISSNLTAGTYHIGDTYWPLGYEVAGMYSTQETSQTAGGVSLGTLNFGRPNEFTTPSIAAHAKWKIQGGSLNIGTLNQLNTNTDFSVSTYGGGYYPMGRTVSTISTEASPDNNVAVTIGDIRLNETMTFLHINAGDWTITGDIDVLPGAAAGNMVAMLFGYDDFDRQFLNVDNSYCAELTIQWTQLLNMIDNGWLWTVDGGDGGAIPAANTGGGGYYATKYVPYGESGVGKWSFEDLFAGNLTGVTHVSRSNMYDLLDMIDVGGGMVNVMYTVPVNVPEPATLALLGLGAVAVFRRRR